MAETTKDELPVSGRFTPKWWSAISTAYVVYVVAIIGFACTILAKAFKCPTLAEAAPYLLAITTMIITLGPPAWFYIEYWFFVTAEWRASEKGRNLIKYEQELPRNIWLAISALCLAALAAMK